MKVVKKDHHHNHHREKKEGGEKNIERDSRVRYLIKLHLLMFHSNRFCVALLLQFTKDVHNSIELAYSFKRSNKTYCVEESGLESFLNTIIINMSTYGPALDDKEGKVFTVS